MRSEEDAAERIGYGEGGSAVFRKRIKGPELTTFLMSIRQNGASADDLLFLCVGTDRSTGDALGPLVGMMLEESGFPHVIGTLRDPLDAGNMVERLSGLPAGKTVIAIDACLGQPSSLACYQVSNQPLEPGKSLGKALPSVGDYTIAAIVNVDGGNKYTILQSTPLYRVYTMAHEIAAAVKEAFPPNTKAKGMNV
ncbi:spore protease YyaC [Paenibacillus piri]|uniref:Spore protease YyaC n=1 Tax=Paenibacillus piri TaxID=2547395 RepID=A0A4V2ZSQ2_9BACL|nr:spore protease YyaC [Paenibacillus piri]TDF94074.1 spore protease YyaC [Paenibacillus piri]